jgi:hypothetical protein
MDWRNHGARCLHSDAKLVEENPMGYDTVGGLQEPIAGLHRFRCLIDDAGTSIYPRATSTGLDRFVLKSPCKLRIFKMTQLHSQVFSSCFDLQYLFQILYSVLFTDGELLSLYEDLPRSVLASSMVHQEI